MAVSSTSCYIEVTEKFDGKILTTKSYNLFNKNHAKDYLYLLHKIADGMVKGNEVIIKAKDEGDNI